MLPQEVIRKKRDGHELSADEIAAFFGGFLSGEVAEYQMSAMLMAIYLKGFSLPETVILTEIMRDSGTVFDWSGDRQTIVDKHSTGGVGDKTSLVIMPLAILEGVKVPMISGRGLGHTGGTLDKLESIGMNVFFSEAEARRLMEEYGGVFMGQTEAMVPLDRRLYAMRDVTSTVESIPLIVGSILSKKLAEGIGGLVMDVKFGSGAFMQSIEDARDLAKNIKTVAEQTGVRTRCLLTSMNAPLGTYAGNALEVKECLDIMGGEGPADTVALIIELTAEMVKLAYPDRELDAIRQTLRGHLASGKARELFSQIAVAQGAEAKYLDTPDLCLQAKINLEVPASSAGFVSAIDTRKLGIAILEMGGGRKLVTDKIDPWVGLSGLTQIGSQVEVGQPLAVIHANNEAAAEAARELVASAYQIGNEKIDDSLIAEAL